MLFLLFLISLWIRLVNDSEQEEGISDAHFLIGAIYETLFDFQHDRQIYGLACHNDRF